MEDAAEAVRHFQQLANEFFFTISPYTINDCLHAFDKLTAPLPIPYFLSALSRCQAFLLIDRADPETLANLLIELLSSDSAATVSLSAALLTRCMGFLAPDYQNDVVDDLCTALDIFVHSGQEKPAIALLLALCSAIHVLQDELYRAHLRACSSILKCSTAQFEDGDSYRILQVFAARAAFELVSSASFVDFFRADDASIIEDTLQEYLRALRGCTGFTILNYLLYILLVNSVYYAFLRVPHYLCALFSFIGGVAHTHSYRVRAVFASFLLLDAFLGVNPEDECREVVTLLRMPNIDKRTLQKLVQTRFDQYCMNYNVPARVVYRIRFY